MNLTYCLSSVVFFSVVVLVIVDGQRTTDDDIDNNEVADLRARVTSLERQLTADKAANNKCACKLNILQCCTCKSINQSYF